MNATPKFATVPSACQLLGLGRTKVHELAGLGSLRLIKAGGLTLVDMDQALAWMAAQPVVQITPPKNAKGPGAPAPA